MSANKILIVDDEEIIVRLLSMSLKSDGYETVTASNGAHGLEVFKAESPDIVVTDIKMPVMDGIALALSAGAQFGPNYPLEYQWEWLRAPYWSIGSRAML